MEGEDYVMEQGTGPWDEHGVPYESVEPPEVLPENAVENADGNLVSYADENTVSYADGNSVPLDNSAYSAYEQVPVEDPQAEYHVHTHAEYHVHGEYQDQVEYQGLIEEKYVSQPQTVIEESDVPSEQKHALIDQQMYAEQKEYVDHEILSKQQPVEEQQPLPEPHSFHEEHNLAEQHGLDQQHVVMPEQHSLESRDILSEQHIVAEHADFVEQDSQVEQKAQDEEQPQIEQPQIEEHPVPLTEEDRLWEVVKANSADFNAWTLLIQESEKSENIFRIRKVYDAFLAEFPLCYGYWKKYTDHEARFGSPERIPEVFEQAVQAVTYSVDIWMHYCVFAMNKFEDPDDIRRLFERGLSYVGTDYLSHLLWDKYIEFETSQNEICRVAQIYTRILQLPIQQLDRFYSGFKNLVATHSVQELRTAEENMEATLASAPEAGVDVTAPQVGDGSSQEGETAELEKFVGVREALYKLAKDQDAKIRDFESAIRRPYFHVKPLDDLQLANWHRYLDFIEKEGDFEKIVKLYERCLIACANYPDYWIRYVQYMEYLGSIEYANNALNRATQIFVKRRPEIHIFAARFKELQGEVEGARAEYELMNSGLAIGLVEAVVKSANFEQRQGNNDAACSIYESAIELEKSREDSRSLSFLFIQYSRFLDQVALKVDKAREVLAAALELLPSSKNLWEAAILFESFHQENKALDYLDSLIEQALAPTRPDGSQGLSAADREEISSIYLELVDLCGDAQAMRKAETRHRLLFPFRKSTSDSKKRSSDGSSSDRAKMYKPSAAFNPTTSPAQGGPPAYANGQSQWGAVYGPQGYPQQPQVWQQAPVQQAPQAQPQQWNSAYTTQQAAYGSYEGYGTYGIPQQQAPQPQQQAAYAGYTQSYAPQVDSLAFPQQNYAQPAPSYTAQQVPAQQGYYGYY